MTRKHYLNGMHFELNIQNLKRVMVAKSVARFFGRGSAILSEVTESVTCFASEAARSV